MDIMNYYDARKKYVNDIQMYMKQLENHPIEMTKEDIISSIRTWRRLYQIADKIEQEYDVDCKIRNDGRIVICRDGNRNLTLPFRYLEYEIAYLFGTKFDKLTDLLKMCKCRPLLGIDNALKTDIDINLSEIAAMSKSIVTLGRSCDFDNYSPQFAIKYLVTANRDGQESLVLEYTHMSKKEPKGPKHEKITYFIDGTNKYSEIYHNC